MCKNTYMAWWVYLLWPLIKVASVENTNNFTTELHGETVVLLPHYVIVVLGSCISKSSIITGLWPNILPEHCSKHGGFMFSAQHIHLSIVGEDSQLQGLTCWSRVSQFTMSCTETTTRIPAYCPRILNRHVVMSLLGYNKYFPWHFENLAPSLQPSICFRF